MTTATDDRIRISNSKSNTFRRCPKAFQFKYEMGLRKKVHGLPLKRGDWLHQLLMVHYDGEDWRARHHVLSVEFNKLFEEEKEEYGDLPTECERIFKAYLAHYKEEDRSWRIVDSEVDELLTLPNGDTFNFIIDLIAEEEDGGLWLWDHKTVGRFMSGDWTLLDSQLARYFWAARKLGYDVQGVMFNELLTKPPTLPKPLKTGGLERRKNIFCDAYTYYGEVKKHGLDPKEYKDFLMMLKSRHDRWFLRTRLPRDSHMTNTLVKELMWTCDDIRLAQQRQRFPRTPLKTDCQFDCDYRDPCIIDLQGGDISDIVKDRYTVRPRRDDEEHTGWVGKGK